MIVGLLKLTKQKESLEYFNWRESVLFGSSILCGCKYLTSELLEVLIQDELPSVVAGYIIYTVGFCSFCKVF
jgi:xanthine/uracil permease